MSDPRKIMQGRQVPSYVAAQQFRSGNNAAINGFSASARTDRASSENLSRSLHSESRAYERSGWEQERQYQISKKNSLFGNK